MMKVVLVSIPSYVLLHLERGFSFFDFIAISLLCMLSVFLFYAYKKLEKESMV